MHSLFAYLPSSVLLRRELPCLGVSLVIAEVFFKFHSFTLECTAFLATWYVLSWLANRVSPAERR